MFSGSQIAGMLVELQCTHVVWVPDSTMGPWEGAIERTPQLTLVRVCREGEAWAVAAGLYVGGAQPMVMIQCTGLFESGDALRNALHDYRLPLMAMIGYRSYLNQDTLPGDTARLFAEPILHAWNLDYLLVTEAGQFDRMRRHFADRQREGNPAIVLLAEGLA